MPNSIEKNDEFNYHFIWLHLFLFFNTARRGNILGKLPRLITLNFKSTMATSPVYVEHKAFPSKAQCKCGAVEFSVNGKALLVSRR